MTLDVERVEPEASATGPRLERPGNRRRVLDAVRSVSRATLWACVVGSGLVLLSLAFPIFLFVTVPIALGLAIAAWTAAMGAAAGSLAWRTEPARITGAIVGAVLALAIVVLLGRRLGIGPWAAGDDLLGWTGTAAVWGGSGLLVVLSVAVTRPRAPFEARSIVSRGLLASAVAALTVVVAAAVTAYSRRPWFDPDDTCGGDGRYEVRPFPVQVACTAAPETPLAPESLEVLQIGGVVIAGVLLIGALLVVVGRRRVAMAAAVVSASTAALLAIATVVVALPLVANDQAMLIRGFHGTSDHGLEQTPIPGTPMQDQDAAESPPADASALPTLDVARAQFAQLAEAALTAAGEGAIWRDEPPLEVREEPCDEGVRLVIDGEFATGVITDTTSDEHDREVTAGNVAAADRIAEAWQAVGLGGVERLHDEPHLGRGSFGAVESARISFDFGVAQPRVEGFCLIGE